MCRELRKKDVLQDVLRLAHDRSLNKYASIDEEDDFQVSFQVQNEQKINRIFFLCEDETPKLKPILF